MFCCLLDKINKTLYFSFGQFTLERWHELAELILYSAFADNICQILGRPVCVNSHGKIARPGVAQADIHWRDSAAAVSINTMATRAIIHKGAFTGVILVRFIQ